MLCEAATYPNFAPSKRFNQSVISVSLCSAVCIDRYFCLLAGLLLAIMAGAQVGSALQESPTNDEPVHMTIGYVYLTTGEYTGELAHPPLGRILAALPLLALPLKPIPPEAASTDVTTLIWGNPVPADTILLRSRLVIIGLSMLFGAWLAWWTRRRFGSPIALLALTFFAFDPSFIAHGHYATTDLLAAFGIFLACTLWADFLQAPDSWRLAAAALGLGFALASKYSALFLLLVLPLLYVVAWWRKRGRPYFTFRGAVGTLAVMSAGATLLVVLPYVPDIRSRVLSPRPAIIAPPPAVTAPDNGLLSFGYFEGLHELFRHDAEGHPAYLLGHFRRTGWWQYFPVAFLVKTPTGVLIACLLAACSVVVSLRQGRQPPPAFLLLCLALPPLAYFDLAMGSSINLGVRHILPVYPFLYVLLALVLIDYAPYLLRAAWRWTVAALVLLIAAESLLIYPHYLAFFNWPSGGPANGSRYLLDSNIDWGQDLKNLGAYVNEHHMTPLCTALFTAAPAGYYGIVARDLNRTGMPEGVENLPCVVAVSVNLLHGLYNAPQKYAPLLRRRPVARIGYSIYVYDLRRPLEDSP